MSYKTVSIFYNEEKERAIDIFNDCYKFLKEKNIKILSKEEVFKANFVILIGGDGTLLRNFKYINDICLKHKQEIPFIIAINAGSMGFLTEATKDNYKDLIENFLNDTFFYEERFILEININNKKYFSLNEVVLTRQNIGTNVVNTHIKVDSQSLAKYRGDGVIISTPTGSTAYSLSVGGPIIFPSLKLILVSPIAPHNLNTRPIILDGDKILELSIIHPSTCGFVNIDGQAITNINDKEKIIIKYSNRKIKLILSKDRNYYDVLRNKLKWGDSLC